MAKPRRRKASVSSSGKVVENDLVQRCRALAEDASLATPVCVGNCVLFCPFDAARKRNVKIQAARDDESALQKFSRRGPRISRAYAAALLVALSGKVPYVAQLRLPTGNVPYAIRGKATPFELAGLQHHDDKRLLLLTVANPVKRRGLHVYATDDGLVSTGRRPAPPREFVEAEMERLGLTAKSPERFVCAHGGADAGDALLLRWKSANVSAELCAACVGDTNSAHRILEHVAAPQARRDFAAEARLAPLRGPGAPAADASSESAARDYEAGTIGDAAFLDRAREARTETLKAMPGRAFVVGERWFGDDVAAFVAALTPTDVERAALEAALAGVDRPVVVDKASAARVLADVWRERGRDALLAAAGGNAVTADALYDADASHEDVADVLKKAASRGAKARVEAALPRFRKLPAPAAVADAVARAYRANGTDAAHRLAQQHAKDGRARGTALAFLRVTGGAGGEDWKFSGVEQSLASTLEADATRLLECAPDEYADVLARIARAAGSTEPLERA